ncbi:hypothetical protein NPIL_700491 [Nephila pilipes]|uniref:Uncharacterized protein n=1 Tax=Nephila pilipes TaxID=299642 RepID=A0A8X6N6Q2_NEPPI|nr:hypothetical protein NPIL_700491 [Nephila pilipes]
MIKDADYSISQRNDLIEALLTYSHTLNWRLWCLALVNLSNTVRLEQLRSFVYISGGRKGVIFVAIISLVRSIWDVENIVTPTIERINMPS